ncbi:hypothetical protein F383_02667 [Gossypium arboreum]|uniref:Uncharacterized protein n=1 Tax=Gossypium arboreum TaxID=29729 RepID=A0A0B0PCS4_GOSAR|nr:hypothetical protein F383_02667 [Gossypium arboreum]
MDKYMNVYLLQVHMDCLVMKDGYEYDPLICELHEYVKYLLANGYEH